MRSAGIAAASAGPGVSGFRHEALLYSTDDEFIEQTTTFIAQGLAHNEAVLTVVEASKLAAIRAALDGDADRAFFADMQQLGRNPALIIQAWRDFVSAHGGRGRAVRGIGEPVTGARDAAALTECHIHESLLNLAFADDPDFWLLCPYDAASLPAHVVDDALGTHPLVCDRHGHRLGDPLAAGIDAGFARPLPAPDTHAEVDAFAFDLDALAALRRFVGSRALALGAPSGRISELTVAVSEIATNAIVHGHGGGTARIWAEGTQVLCEVTGPGRITDPLIGRLRPARSAARTRDLAREPILRPRADQVHGPGNHGTYARGLCGSPGGCNFRVSCVSSAVPG